MKLWINAPDLGAQNEEQIAQRVMDLNLDGVSLINAGFSVEKAVELHDLLKENGKSIFLVDDFEIAKAIHCPNVLVHLNEDFDSFASKVSVLCDEYKALGFNVVIEGGLDLTCQSPEQLNEVRGMVSRDNLKFFFDLPRYLNAANYEYRWPVFSYALNTFAPEIAAFSVSDCYCDGQEVHRVCVGKGEFDYEYLTYLMHRVHPTANLLFYGTTGEDLEPAVKHLLACIKQFD